VAVFLQIHILVHAGKTISPVKHEVFVVAALYIAMPVLLHPAIQVVHPLDTRVLHPLTITPDITVSTRAIAMFILDLVP
jgi:hypothetical protein